MLYELLYTSLAMKDFDPESLSELVESAAKRNGESGITGLLVYRSRAFYHVIEGKEAAVRNLFETIRQDPRHTDARILWEGSIEERDYADWPMGFVYADLLDVEDAGSLFPASLEGGPISQDPSYRQAGRELLERADALQAAQ